ncbi:ribonuclease H2, subunit C [Scleroderma citrinum]
MALEIAPSTGPLQTSSPNLMPFHIEYTGPAPISRYFRPKSVPTSDVTQDLTTASSVVTVTGEGLAPGTSGSQSSITSQTSVATSVTVVDAVDVNPNETVSATQINVAEQQLVAAFRGRQMIGNPINLPAGYGGLVLQIPSGKGDGKSAQSDSKPISKANANAKSTGRRSTRALKTERDVTMDEETELTEGDPEQGILPQDVRQLIPMSTFSSFTIWSPDIPADQGKDEYVRCLVEWTKLAAEVLSTIFHHLT